MTDICAWGVFEFMYDVGANNIKVGRDRKMAPLEVGWRGKTAVNQRPTLPELFYLTPTETFAHYYWGNREFMYAVFNKMFSPRSVSRTIRHRPRLIEHFAFKLFPTREPASFYLNYRDKIFFSLFTCTYGELIRK